MLYYIKVKEDMDISRITDVVPWYNNEGLTFVKFVNCYCIGFYDYYNYFDNNVSRKLFWYSYFHMKNVIIERKKKCKDIDEFLSYYEGCKMGLL